MIVEQPLSLSGFQRLTQHIIGPIAPELQSMHVDQRQVRANS